MMLPPRNDITIECDPSEGWKSNTLFCRIVRTVVFVVALVLLLMVLGAWSQKPNDVNEEPSKAPVSSLPSTCTIEIGEKMKEEIKSWIQKEVEMSSKICSKGNKFNPEQMRNMVKEEIKRQQKTQLKPDFASASAGGMVLEASPTWTEGYSYIYFLFIPIRSTAPPPSTVLEPTRQAGDCWPMEGQKGRLLIQLAARANIVGFTMEHIDPAMSLSGATPEAPNNFSVYGIENVEASNRKHLFGIYYYNNKNEEQSFRFMVSLIGSIIVEDGEPFHWSRFKLKLIEKVKNSKWIVSIRQAQHRCQSLAIKYVSSNEFQPRKMAPPDEGSKRKNTLPNSLNHTPLSSPRLPHDYIEQLVAELREEREEKEALNLERAKLKVCWEMTLEELAMTRAELSDKIYNLETELQKQVKWKKVLQKLLREYGENLEEIKGVIENILIERPKCNVKY